MSGRNSQLTRVPTSVMSAIEASAACARASRETCARSKTMTATTMELIARTREQIAASRGLLNRIDALLVKALR